MHTEPIYWQWNHSCEASNKPAIARASPKIKELFQIWQPLLRVTLVIVTQGTMTLRNFKTFTQVITKCDESKEPLKPLAPALGRPPASARSPACHGYKLWHSPNHCFSAPCWRGTMRGAKTNACQQSSRWQGTIPKACLQRAGNS
jgi:hypothetical protein